MVVAIKSTDVKTHCGRCKKSIAPALKIRKGWIYNHTTQMWVCKACQYQTRGKKGESNAK